MSLTTEVFKIRKTPLSRSKLLTVDPSFLLLEDSSGEIYFSKDEIESIRYGATGFRYYLFPFSMSLTIEIRNNEGEVMRLNMHGFFKIGYKKLGKLWISIHRHIHKCYFNDIAVQYIKLLNSGLGFELSGAIVSSEGVQFRKASPLIPWIRVGMRSYKSSFVLLDETDPVQTRVFDYYHEWNASILRLVVSHKLGRRDSF